MVVKSEIGLDARVQREAATLAGDGHEVVIICQTGATWDDAPASVQVETVGLSSPFPSAGERGQLDPLRTAARWALLPAHRAAVEARFRDAARERAATLGAFDVVHVHDFPALPLGAELATMWGSRLVYDAHECWTGRPRHGRPTPLLLARQRRLERQLGARAHAVLTVSHALATWFEDRYGWTHVEIVRNSFPLGTAPLPLPTAFSGVVYAGRLGPDRDLETLVRALPGLGAVDVVLVGPRDATWLANQDLGAGVDLRDAVAVDEVDPLLRDVGIALVPLTDGSLNHRVALPNKLFQAVRAGVPVVAADLPELRRVVTEHDLGALYRPGDADSLVAAVRAVTERWSALVASVDAARTDLAWEVDSERLRAVYDRFAPA